MSYTRLYEYAWAQNQVASDYAKKAQGTYTSYLQDVEKLAADARNKARVLVENYYQTLRAAGLGDDALERASAAWSVYQQEYAKLSEEYQSAVYNRYESLASSLPTFQLEASQQAMDNYINLLQEARKELTPNA